MVKYSAQGFFSKGMGISQANLPFLHKTLLAA
jgi:hypothetical protein